MKTLLPLETILIPGITSIQALTVAHAIPLNRIGAPFTVTTGRRLREHGWSESTGTLVVMLDGDCAFQTLPPENFIIWWTAYAGTPGQISISGPLGEVTNRILQTRAEARARHGWIMDIYLLRRDLS